MSICHLNCTSRFTVVELRGYLSITWIANKVFQLSYWFWATCVSFNLRSKLVWKCSVWKEAPGQNSTKLILNGFCVRLYFRVLISSLTMGNWEWFLRSNALCFSYSTQFLLFLWYSLSFCFSVRSFKYKAYSVASFSSSWLSSVILLSVAEIQL